MGLWFEVLIKYVIPLVLIGLLTWSILTDLGIADQLMGKAAAGAKGPEGLYGHSYPFKWGKQDRLPIEKICFGAWLGLSLLAALILTLAPEAKQPKEANDA